MEETKSVIEHLEDIEEHLKPKNQKPLTISDMIGEPFDPFFDSCTVYYYESNERKFNKHRKGQCTKLSIFTAIYFIPVIIDLILSIIFKTNLTWLFISDVILFLCPLFYLIYGLKQKSKKLANSKWNIKNHVFYKYDKKLGQEDNKGFIGKLLITYKFISLLSFVAFAIPVLLKITDGTVQSIIGWTHYGFICLIFGIHISLTYDNYYYDSYIFDNKDSYVLYQYGTWKKYKK